MPAAHFSGRVSHLGDGNMTLSCATVGDIGVYTLDVLQNDGARFRNSQAVTVKGELAVLISSF